MGIFDAGAMQVGIYVSMDGTTFNGDLNCDQAQIGGSLYMRSTEQSKASFKGVRLVSAKVSGSVDMNGSFDGDINADGLQVDGSLFMRPIGQRPASFKGVNLTFAKVGGSVEMSGAVFEGELNLSTMQVGAYVNISGATLKGDLNGDQVRIGGSLFMQSTDQSRASYKGVRLTSVKVSGNAQLSGIFDGNVNADGLQVEGSLFMRSTEQSTSNLQERGEPDVCEGYRQRGNGRGGG
jgi:cytoskeletal protein CcmA (bactofilin family)